MAAPPVLDTNVVLRHLRQDHPDPSARASAYFARIERGEIEVRLVATVIFETVFTLERVYRQSRPAIRDGVLPLFELEGIVLAGKRLLRRAFALYVGTSLSFADAYHAALAEQFAGGEIVSFDRGLDRVPSLRRVET
jgi:predicted nucleic acid-binding protein